MQYLGEPQSDKMILLQFQGKPFSITVIQVYVPTTDAEAEVDWCNEALQHFLKLKLKKEVLFITQDWNTKVGSQEIPEITGKFDLGVQNEAGQSLTEFQKEDMLFIADILFQQPKR